MSGPELIYQDEGGWWWPSMDQTARPVILRDCAPSIEALLPHVLGRQVIVQAGANVGVYGVALTDHFNMVLTVEPDPVNYLCLKRNLAARDSLHRVKATEAAFGEVDGLCVPVEVHARNCGAHRVAFGVGSVPVITIDGFELDACDCIWGDVEGAELPMLKGAAKTIERFSPIIAVEDKGLHRAFDIEDGALQAWLAERDYREVDRIGRDKIFRRMIP